MRGSRPSRRQTGAGSLRGPARPNPDHASVPGTREILALSAWRHPALSSASQAGLINNLNDGVTWGLFPLFFAAAGLGVADIGWLIFIYPLYVGRLSSCGPGLGRTVWGVSG